MKSHTNTLYSSPKTDWLPASLHDTHHVNTPIRPEITLKQSCGDVPDCEALLHSKPLPALNPIGLIWWLAVYFGT